VAARIAVVHKSLGCPFQLVLGASSQPYAYVMAVLVVTMKLFYGLDGQSRCLPESLPLPPDDWHVWAEEVVRRGSKPSIISLVPSVVISPEQWTNH